ncbi:hypothetical protein [Metabacillus malikii]|uniref:Membrane protein n=1 Tax=Metabacillus malikii TaxID=1504265 RepID=A0ABT9ZLU9_9BACI|nr:hypothetical protein [Metabacillus malikii]MDQ0233277.1 putative membrane protein [Metabacillus malikii]
MTKRIITAALSVIIFALIFSWFTITPSSQREPNVYYFRFDEMYSIVLIYAAPVYFLVGLPFSIFIDKFIAKINTSLEWTRYFFGLGLYTFAGLLVGAIILIILKKLIIPIFILCLFASNIYYHLHLLVSQIKRESEAQN